MLEKITIDKTETKTKKFTSQRIQAFGMSPDQQSIYISYLMEDDAGAVEGRIKEIPLTDKKVVKIIQDLISLI